jgi:hypothetical protein
MRSKNITKSKRITFTTTPQVYEALQNLVRLGLHGTSIADASERLVCEGLRGDLRRKRASLFEPPKTGIENER